MATSFAPIMNPSPRLPMDRSFPMSPAARPSMKIIPRRATAMATPNQAADLRAPLDKPTAGRSRREYLAHETVYSQGDQSNAVFYIQSGKVKLTVVSSSGKEAVIAHLSAGSFLGEASLAGEQNRSASASTLQSCIIIRIDKAAMQQLLVSEPRFAEQFQAYLLARNSRMEADLVDHLFNSSEKRLARLLMLMANFGQDTKPKPVLAKISQENLAEMIGTTRSRVSFFLNRFRDLGYIDYSSGGMRVNGSLANIVLQN